MRRPRGSAYRVKVSERFAERPALDGLRAIAALLVLFFHAGVPFLAGGYLGVDVFFVLSGFLITSILILEFRSTGRIRFSSFYARRARRLLPAALLVLLVTAVVYRNVAPPVALLENEAGFVAAAIYLSNWLFMAQSQNYFAEAAYPSPVLHYWSLSVEEQFYVLWPALLIAILIAVRRRPRLVLPAMVVLAAAGVAVSAWLTASAPESAYFNTIARVYQLLLGAVLAAWVVRSTITSRPRIGTSLATVGLVGLVTLAVVDPSPWLGGVLACAATLAVLAGNEFGAGAVARGLSTHPMRALGRWSYSTYLWHWPVIVIGGIVGVLPAPWPLRAAAVAAVTLSMAALTYRFVERPFQSIAIGSAVRRSAVIGTGLASSIAAAVALTVIVSVPATVRTTYAAAVEGQETATEGAEAVEFIPASSEERPTVMVIGDSHANYWRDAFNEYGRENDVEVVFVTRLSCPWMRVPAINPETGGDFRCEQRLWNRALQAIDKHEPDLVVLTSRSILSRELRLDGRAVGADEPGWESAVRDGIDRSLRDLQGRVGAIALIEPVPETDTSMLDCVLGYDDPRDARGRCDQRSVAKPGMQTVERLLREVDRKDPTVVSISLDEAICPAGLCPAVSDGVPTYRDHQHLTWDFAHQVLPELMRKLSASGIDWRSASDPGSR